MLVAAGVVVDMPKIMVQAGKEQAEAEQSQESPNDEQGDAEVSTDEQLEASDGQEAEREEPEEWAAPSAAELTVAGVAVAETAAFAKECVARPFGPQAMALKAFIMMKDRKRAETGCCACGRGARARG